METNNFLSAIQSKYVAGYEFNNNYQDVKTMLVARGRLAEKTPYYALEYDHANNQIIVQDKSMAKNYTVVLDDSDGHIANIFFNKLPLEGSWDRIINLLDRCRLRAAVLAENENLWKQFNSHAVIEPDKKDSFLDSVQKFDSIFQEDHSVIFSAEAPLFGKLFFARSPANHPYLVVVFDIPYKTVLKLSQNKYGAMQCGTFDLPIYKIVQKIVDRSWDPSRKTAVYTYCIVQHPGTSIFDQVIDPEKAPVLAQQLLEKIANWLKIYLRPPRLITEGEARVFYDPSTGRLTIIALRNPPDLITELNSYIESIEACLGAILRETDILNYCLQACAAWTKEHEQLETIENMEYAAAWAEANSRFHCYLQRVKKALDRGMWAAKWKQHFPITES